MPETIAGSTAATLLIAALALLLWLTRDWEGHLGALLLKEARRRLGGGTGGDEAWAEGMTLFSSEEDEEERPRRWFRRKEREGPAEEEAAATSDVFETRESAAAATPQTAPEAPEAEPPPPPPSPRRVGLDHVPFEAPGEDSEEAARGRFRDRLSRSMKKTRDYLNRDVREVFGPGPVPEAFDGLEEVLVRADVGIATAASLSDDLRERGRDLSSDTLPQALRETMRSHLMDADRRLRVNVEGPSVWLVVGVNGTGKTTTIAKLARHVRSQGFRVCLVAADTFRAAAIEQLQAWGERLDIEVVSQRAGADPGAVVFDGIARAKARDYDLVIVDTAGRLHTRKPLMEELRKVRRVIDREEGLLTECLLVVDATTGQNGISQARAFQEAVDVTGLVLAKLDGTAKGGIVFAVERELGLPVKAIGIGEKPADLAPFDPDSFLDALFEGADSAG